MVVGRGSLVVASFTSASSLLRRAMALTWSEVRFGPGGGMPGQRRAATSAGDGGGPAMVAARQVGSEWQPKGCVIP